MKFLSWQNKIDLSSAPWTMHEFFAGSGLAAYGFKGMFRPVWANDISEQKAAVYKANFVEDYFKLTDIKKINGRDLPFAHLSWASFPCQDLSLAGSLGGIKASRSGLVWEWLRVLDEMEKMPNILALENVLGLISTKNGDNYRALHAALVERGFKSGAIVLNASLFLPQSRPRVFVIAVKREAPIPPALVSARPNWLHNQAAIDLGFSLRDWIWWQTEKPGPRHISLNSIIEADAPFDKDHVLRLIPERHQKTLDQHESVIATGYRRTRHGEQKLELRFDGIAGCLRTPAGGSSKQYLIAKHKGETHARLLTARETARLMGVPDTFRLPGNYNDGYMAMGDAVAAPVAHFIAEKFLAGIAGAIYDK